MRFPPSNAGRATTTAQVMRSWSFSSSSLPSNYHQLSRQHSITHFHLIFFYSFSSRYVVSFSHQLLLLHHPFYGRSETRRRCLLLAAAFLVYVYSVHRCAVVWNSASSSCSGWAPPASGSFSSSRASGRDRDPRHPTQEVCVFLLVWEGFFIFMGSLCI